MEWLSSPEAWIALATLTLLEIVLGIDNIIFISHPRGQACRRRSGSAPQLGLVLAMGTRILLLLSLTWIMRLTAPLFTVFGRRSPGRDLILIGGGLFLIAKSTHEIHRASKAGGRGGREPGKRGDASSRVLVQIALIDIVFSLDSVITAVGMANELGVMIARDRDRGRRDDVRRRPIGEFVDGTRRSRCSR